MTTAYRSPIPYRSPILYRGDIGTVVPTPTDVSAGSAFAGRYRIIVADLASQMLGEIPPKNLQYSDILGGDGSCSFSLPLRHPSCRYDLLTPSEREIWVYREGTRVWGGYLQTAQKGQDDSMMQFGCTGWLSAFGSANTPGRLIEDTLTYVQQDQFDIAWGIIDYTQQQSDLGFRRYSTTKSTVKRDRTYNSWELKNIGDALRELAAVQNGFDFEIDPYKRWKVYYPQKGTRVTTAVFDLKKNIRGYGYSIDGTSRASKIWAVGAMGVLNTPLLASSVDSSALAATGLKVDTRSFTDVSLLATLQAHSDEELRVAKNLNIMPQISVVVGDPAFGVVQVGDSARIIIHQGYVQMDTWMRAKARVVAVSDAGNEAMGFYFDDEVSA